MEKRLRLEFAALAAVPFVMVLGNSMLIPVFPKIKEAMDITQFQVGLLVTAFSVPAALLIPFAGALSDHVGRKIVMAPALVLYGTGGLIAGAAAVWLNDPYPLVLAGRVVQGLGAGGTYLLAMALTGDIFTGSERPKALGLLEAANGLGKVVSPLLGAAVALWSWYAPFFVYGALAFPVALSVWLLVKEPKAWGRGKAGRYGQELVKIVRQRGVPLLACYLSGMAALFLLFGVLSFVSDELEGRFQVSGFASGLWLAVPVGAMALTAYAVGFLLQSRLQWLKPGVLAGLALVIAGLAVSPFTMNGLVGFIMGIGVLGVGVGTVLPCLNMLITSAADQTERGVVTSFYGTVRFLGVALGPPTFALAVEMGRSFMFWGAAGLGLVVFALAWWLIRPETLLPSDERGEGAGEPEGESAGGGGEQAGEDPAEGWRKPDNKRQKGLSRPDRGRLRRSPHPIPHN